MSTPQAAIHSAELLLQAVGCPRSVNTLQLTCDALKKRGHIHVLLRLKCVEPSIFTHSDKLAVRALAIVFDVDVQRVRWALPAEDFDAPISECDLYDAAFERGGEHWDYVEHVPETR